ncbi:MAG TPA: PrsW family intramembrane metalloprotease [Thermoanaerobaculia bacterium]|nr:PrsW family intramembrane metalloprotease [Thermoanaerobaculia bacterium]
MPRTRPSTWIVAGLILAACCVLGLLALVMIGFGTGPAGFFVGFVMAAIPVPFYIAFALWVDRFEPEAPWVLALAFFWGATIAVFFSILFNGLSAGIFSQLAGAANAATLTAVLAAPFGEELSKGAALFLLFLWKRDEFDNVTDGIVYASMVGLGFAMTENVQYYGEAFNAGGGAQAAALFILRGVMGPFSHPLYTSMTGIGFGLARESDRRSVKILAPLGGLAVAMLLHGIWNLSASFGLVVFATYFLVMVPALIAVIVIAIYSLRREAMLIRKHLDCVVAEGVLASEDVVVVTSVTRRVAASTRALFEGGPSKWIARRRFHALATELAFHAWRTSREANADAQLMQAELVDAVRAARAAI